MTATKTFLQNPLVAILDDDASMRTSVRRLVNAFGYRTETFASAREFLSANRHQKFACLILDLRMPGMNGLALQRWLAALDRHAPQIIFITGHGSAEDKMSAIEAGAAGFLSKPVSAQILFNAIFRALHGYIDRESNVLPVNRHLSRTLNAIAGPELNQNQDDNIDESTGQDSSIAGLG
jgi:FixJ family two-component response regulator